MNINYRKSVRTDIPVIEQLFTEMLKSVPGSDAIVGYERGYLEKFFDSDDAIYVAEKGGEVIGYISVEAYPGSAYIDDLCVTKKLRGIGIGTKLIKLAEQYAENRGASDVSLHVARTNTAARYLYQRLGYAVSDEEESRFKMTKYMRRG